MAAVALPDELVARFRVVAGERLERIETLWSALTSGQDPGEAGRSLGRELHTLKGEARSMGFVDIDLLCHRLEAMSARAARKSYVVPDDFDLLFVGAVQFVAMLLRKQPGQGFGGIDLAGFVRQVDSMLEETFPPERPQRSTTARRRIVQAQVDRVSPATAEGLAQAATRVFLESLRPLENREQLRAIWRDLAKRVRDLTASPVQPRLEALTQSSQRLANELGREVNITLEAKRSRVSPDVLEVLSTALMHALRNAIDHGIEPPEERRRAGKSPEGMVAATISADGDRVQLVVEDDGRGLNLDLLRARGVELGAISKEHAASLRPEELYALTLGHGFTTRLEAGEVSGRGIGLDAVREAAESRGGHVFIQPREPFGTVLTVDMPDNGWTLTAHAIRAPGSDIILAVPEQWQPETATFEPHDVLHVLGVWPAARVGRAIAFRRGVQIWTVLSQGNARPVLAERLCPTRASDTVEVVSIEGSEALLLRPDAWLSPRSSRPPSVTPHAGGA